MFKVNFQKWQQDVWIVLKRFPLAVLSCLLLTILALNTWPSHWNIHALTAAFIVNVFWFLSMQLFTESRKWNRWLAMGVAIPVAAIIGVYLYNLSVLMYPFIVLTLGFALLTMISPFLMKGTKKVNIWTFNYRLLYQFFFSLLASFVLGTGLCILLISLDYLFNFKLFYDQYQKLTIVIGYFFLPLMVMTGIPSRFDEKPLPQQGRGIQLLLDYVMTPILIVFGFIIIAYAIKILSMQYLPRGKVAYLVSLLGGFGILAYILGDRESKSISSAHLLFRRHFFHLMVIPLILMGVGIGVRVHQYGITPHRYAVGALFLWLFLCSFYSFIFTREKLSRFVLISGASLLILASFGPWGIVDLSVHSQFKRLQSLLEKNQILVNNAIQKNHPAVSAQEEYEISSTLSFLIQQGKALELKSWFGPNRWQLFDVPNPKQIRGEDLAQEMGIRYSLTRYPGDEKDRHGEKRSFSFVLKSNGLSWINIDGYDYVFPGLRLFVGDESLVRTPVIETSLPKIQHYELIVTFERKSQVLTVKQKDASKAILSINLADLFHKLRGKTDDSFLKKALTFEGSSGTLKVRLLINPLRVDLDEKGRPNVWNIGGDLFIKTVHNNRSSQ
jgi:hypothetical protein